MRNCLKIFFSMLFLNTSLFGYVEFQPDCDKHNPNKDEHRDHDGDHRDHEDGHQAVPHLIYHGGSVVTNVKVVNVLWGQDVDPRVKNAMPTYFDALVTGLWIDGLSEYNTIAKRTPTTNQAIGRGAFIGQFTIMPSITADVVTESDIRDELTLQLDSGNLPAPEYDDLGNPETLYVIEFPADLSIVADDGSESCVDFCAFHGDMIYNGKSILYSIHPDFSGACSFGCGRGSILQNQQSAHCHELSEAITDARVSTGTLAWYDDGEVADFCNQLTKDVEINGQIVRVQKLWSNVRNQCIAILPSVPSPMNFAGNVIATSGGISHELTWEPVPGSFINGFRIIQGGTVVAQIPKEGPYTVTIAGRDPSLQYVYRLVAYNDSGIQSTFQEVTLP